MLLYPEFRSLEGMIKEKLSNYNLVVSEHDDIESFGCFFLKTQNGSFIIKQKYQSNILDKVIQNRLSDAYSFFNKHRNRLFHMDEHVDSSRMMSDMNEMNRISETIYTHLKNLI